MLAALAARPGEGLTLTKGRGSQQTGSRAHAWKGWAFLAGAHDGRTISGVCVGLNHKQNKCRGTEGGPPCQARGSRSSTAPAGVGQQVDSFIQDGSPSMVGIGSREFCVPGICRPARAVRAGSEGRGEGAVTVDSGQARRTWRVGPLMQDPPTAEPSTSSIG